MIYFKSYNGMNNLLLIHIFLTVNNYKINIFITLLIYLFFIRENIMNILTHLNLKFIKIQTNY